MYLIAFEYFYKDNKESPQTPMRNYAPTHPKKVNKKAGEKNIPKQYLNFSLASEYFPKDNKESPHASHAGSGRMLHFVATSIANFKRSLDMSLSLKCLKKKASIKQNYPIKNKKGKRNEGGQAGSGKMLHFAATSIAIFK
jgi:hypothetical protein